MCNTGITGGNTQINVGGEAAAKNLALVLQTGALPITLQQQSTERVSPSLGRDSLDAELQVSSGWAWCYLRAPVLPGPGPDYLGWPDPVLPRGLHDPFHAGTDRGARAEPGWDRRDDRIDRVNTDSYIVAFERLKDQAQQERASGPRSGGAPRVLCARSPWWQTW